MGRRAWWDKPSGKKEKKSESPAENVQTSSMRKDITKAMKEQGYWEDYKLFYKKRKNTIK